MAKIGSDILLRVNERISDNLSSEQIANILDHLIFKALKPLIEHTTYVEQSLVEMLPFIASNIRRKFSDIPQSELVDIIFSIIVNDNTKAKLKLIKSLRLERTIYFNCFSSFNTLAATYNQNLIVYSMSNKKSLRYGAEQAMKNLELSVGLKESSIKDVNDKVVFWNDLALTFKGMVKEKFIRMAWVEAGKATHDTSLTIDKEDLFMDYVIALSRAIDKFNPEKGTLTAYIKWWFMDAKTPTNNRHEYNTAFAIPTTFRKNRLEAGKIMLGNLTTEIDEKSINANAKTESVLDDIIAQESVIKAGNLASKADPMHMAALLHSIQYHLTDGEKQSLRDTLK